jgi:predicted phosphoadenosine phosphosulfate sulfurtransferase
MEAYSKRMAVAVRRDLREANAKRFAELLAYYKVRGGPGLGLAQKEQEAREQRQLTNYPPQAA